jgi:hypothetical protein
VTEDLEDLMERRMLAEGAQLPSLEERRGKSRREASKVAPTTSYRRAAVQRVKMVSFRTTEDRANDIERWAVERGMSKTELLEEAVDQWRKTNKAQ